MSGLIINPFVFAVGGGGGSYEYGMTELLATPSTFSATQQVGYLLIANATRTVVGLRMYGAAVGSEVLRLWNREDSSLVASVTITSAVGEWVEGLFASPVTITNGTRYIPSARRVDAASRTVAYLSWSNVVMHDDVDLVGLASYNNTDGYPGTVGGTFTYGMVDLILEA